MGILSVINRKDGGDISFKITQKLFEAADALDEICDLVEDMGKEQSEREFRGDFRSGSASGNRGDYRHDGSVEFRRRRR